MAIDLNGGTVAVVAFFFVFLSVLRTCRIQAVVSVKNGLISFTCLTFSSLPSFLRFLWVYSACINDTTPCTMWHMHVAHMNISVVGMHTHKHTCILTRFIELVHVCTATYTPWHAHSTQMYKPRHVNTQTYKPRHVNTHKHTNLYMHTQTCMYILALTNTWLAHNTQTY